MMFVWNVAAPVEVGTARSSSSSRRGVGRGREVASLMELAVRRCAAHGEKSFDHHVFIVSPKFTFSLFDQAGVSPKSTAPQSASFHSKK